MIDTATISATEAGQNIARMQPTSNNTRYVHSWKPLISCELHLKFGLLRHCVAKSVASGRDVRMARSVREGAGWPVDMGLRYWGALRVRGVEGRRVWEGRGRPTAS